MAGRDDHPPCPTEDGPPPGHNKGGDPQPRPCDGRGHHGGDVAGGAVIVLPVGLVAWLLGVLRPAAPSRRRRDFLRVGRRAR